MGVTHSWERETELSPAAFEKAVNDCRKLLPTLGVTLAGPLGSGSMVLSPDAIAFNGAGVSGCEPFEVHATQFDRRGRKRFYQFCKTEHAPYDICVKVALIVLKQHLGDAFAVVSDEKNEQWDQARQMCSKLLGYGDQFVLAS